MYTQICVNSLLCNYSCLGSIFRSFFIKPHQQLMIVRTARCLGLIDLCRRRPKVCLDAAIDSHTTNLPSTSRLWRHSRKKKGKEKGLVICSIRIGLPRRRRRVREWNFVWRWRWRMIDFPQLFQKKMFIQ